MTIRAEDGAVVCECGLGELLGIPCCHAVKVRSLSEIATSDAFLCNGTWFQMQPE